MILPRPEDAFHKIQLYRLLTAILDAKELAQNLYFKGGSCAAMLGWLDRFSVDLDFDVNPGVDKLKLKQVLASVFQELNLEIKNPKTKTLQFILGYEAKHQKRNQLKLGVVDNPVLANDYQPAYLAEIDRYALCQTRGTMVANKLVAPVDRFEKYGTVAGRDIYDIHYFLSAGYGYKPEIIEERRQTKVGSYLKQLERFIFKRVTDRVISEDLSYLLPYEKFRAIRKTLKTEALLLLRDEMKRMSFGRGAGN